MDDVSLRIMRCAKKDATTPDEIYFDNLPHLCLKLVGTTMLIVNENMIVDSFALRGKKTKSAFSNNTLVIQRIETRNKYDLRRLQVHNDARPEEIENFLKRIKSVTTFLTVEDSQQYVPSNTMDTDTDSTMYDSAPVINNVPSSRENTLKMPQASSLNCNMKTLANDWNSTDTDSTVGNSISLLRSLQIDEGTPVKINNTFVPSRIIEEGPFKTNSDAMPYSAGERGSFNTAYGNMPPPIGERRLFGTTNRNVPPSILNRSFEKNSAALPYPVGERIPLKTDMPSRFEERRTVNTTYQNMPPPIEGRISFDTTNRNVPPPITNRKLFETNSAVLPNQSTIAERRSSIIDNRIISYPVGERIPLKTDMPSRFEERRTFNTTHRNMPPPIEGRIPFHTTNRNVPPPITNRKLFETNSAVWPNQSTIAERSSIIDNRIISYPVGESGQYKPNNGIMVRPTEERRQFTTSNNILPSTIGGKPFNNGNMQPSSIEERRQINENMSQAIGERQLFRPTNEILPYPIEERRPSESTTDLKPSKVFQRGPLDESNGNVASFAEKPLLTASEIVPNSYGITHMDVDTDIKNDALSLRNDLTNQGSQYIETFALTNVNAEACISEPLRLGPLLIRKVMEKIPESSLTVLTDPNYNDHFKAVEEALERGTDCQPVSEESTDFTSCNGCAKQPIRDIKKCDGRTENHQLPPLVAHYCSGNSEREIMKAFVRSDAFLPFIEGIKSLLNNDHEE